MNDFEHLGERVAIGLGGVPDDRYEQVRSAFLREAAQRRSSKQRLVRWTGLVTLVGIIVGGGWWLNSSTASEAVASLAAEDLWLEGPKHGPPTRVELGNGAHLDLVVGTRSRVHRTREAHTRVTLEAGVLEALVAEGDGESWSFYAGPYLVKTTGGEFFLNYQPTESGMEVGVSVGSLRISGGALGTDSVTLNEGQKLNVGDGSISVSKLGAP